MVSGDSGFINGHVWGYLKLLQRDWDQKSHYCENIISSGYSAADVSQAFNLRCDICNKRVLEAEFSALKSQNCG